MAGVGGGVARKLRYCASQISKRARNFAPFWIENGKFNAKGRAALARIDHASEDGLDLRAFPISVPRGGDADTLAAAELALTDAAVAYANQASGGRVDPSRLAPLIRAKPGIGSAHA